MTELVTEEAKCRSKREALAKYINHAEFKCLYEEDLFILSCRFIFLNAVLVSLVNKILVA